MNVSSSWHIERESFIMDTTDQIFQVNDKQISLAQDVAVSFSNLNEFSYLALFLIVESVLYCFFPLWWGNKLSWMRKHWNPLAIHVIDWVCLVHCIDHYDDSAWVQVWHGCFEGHSEPSRSHQKASSLTSTRKWVSAYRDFAEFHQVMLYLVMSSPQNSHHKVRFDSDRLYILKGPAPFPSDLVARRTRGANQTDLSAKA